MATEPKGALKVPPVGDDLAAFLEHHYPAKCWDPTQQAEWQHHRYAGMQALADFLVQANKDQRSEFGLETGSERADKEP